MDKDIQQGRTCTLELDPESSAAIEFGDSVYGRIIGRDVVDASKGSMNEMYQTQNSLPVILVEGEEGMLWHVPERDVKKIVCGQEELC